MDFHPPFGSRGTVSFVLRSDLLLSLRLFSPTLSEFTSALEFSSSLRASFFRCFRVAFEGFQGHLMGRRGRSSVTAKLVRPKEASSSRFGIGREISGLTVRARKNERDPCEG